MDTLRHLSTARSLWRATLVGALTIAFVAVLVVLGGRWQALATGHLAPRPGGTVMVVVVPPAGQEIPQATIDRIRAAPGIRAVAPSRIFEGRLGLQVEGHDVLGVGGSVFAVAPPPGLFVPSVGSLDPTDVSAILLTPNALRSLGLKEEFAVGRSVFIDVRRGPYGEQSLRFSLHVAGVVGDGVIHGIGIVTPIIGDRAEDWMHGTTGGQPRGAQRLWVYAGDEGTVAAVARRAGLMVLGPTYGTR